MLRNVRFDWDPELGQSVCTIIDKDKIYQGFAWCREEDKDMQSEKTGCIIAEYRAHIAQLKAIRDNDIKPKIAALKHFKNTINQSKYYDPDSYPVRMLDRQIAYYEEELEILKDVLKSYKGGLNKFLSDKADFYSKVRKNRAKDKLG